MPVTELSFFVYIEIGWEVWRQKKLTEYMP